MKQLLFIAFVLLFVIVTGCGTKPGEVQVDGQGTNSTINMSELNKQTAPANITPVTTTTAMAPTIPTPVNPGAAIQPTATTSAAGMNPAHGQPGHRCDIPVGAPLNSPVVNSAPQTTTTALAPGKQQTVTTITPPPTSSAPVKTAPGMNPPHGQPGHRCDIAVGAPLNSAPATTTTTNSISPVNSNVVPGSMKPSIVQSSPATTKVAPGMNPSHGQPGHRCDIAVGAPLNSKPEPSQIVPVTPEAAKTEAKKDN